MATVTIRRVLAVTLFAVGSSATWRAPASAAPAGGLTARSDKLLTWTTQVRDQQPEDAFAAVYRSGTHHLIFVGAVHANQVESLTFRIIREAFSSFRLDAVIAEGFPTARGPNPQSIFNYVSQNGPDKDGFVEAGELAPTALGAKAKSATLWGGEAQDTHVKARLLAEGFSAADILGFYVLRNIPQWIRERQVQSAGDAGLKPLVEQALAQSREKLQLPPDVLPSFERWATWYKAINGKPIDATFATEEVGPLADGKFGTNRIAYAVSRVRDAYLHELVVDHINKGESVLVVFGGSHLMIQRPAFDAVLGSPCYVGSDLQRAAAVCR